MMKSKDVSSLEYNNDLSQYDTVIDIDKAPNIIVRSDENTCVKTGITVFAYKANQTFDYFLDTATPQCFQLDNKSGILEYCSSMCDELVNKSAIKVVALSNKNKLMKGVFEIEFEGVQDSVTSKQVSNLKIDSLLRPKVLLDFNEGNNKTLSGWLWQDDVAYGNPGWILKESQTLGEGQKFRWGNGPRIFNKYDYGKQNSAFITLKDKAPSTSSGGALVVHETEGSLDHRSTWWVWYDGLPLSERGITTDKTDRMSFYLKLKGTNQLNDDGKDQSIKNNVHIGTYLCWEESGQGWSTGEGCPYEGPGNQHYYHYLAVNPGAWIHVLLDRHPQHHRNVKKRVPNNPVSKQSKNYFAQLNKFYLEVRYPQTSQTQYLIDEIEFYSTKDGFESNQNDESITSLWVGYWSNKQHWEIGFHDESFEKLRDGTFSTFDIRWSTEPITNENFLLATPIKPQFYSGRNYTGNDFSHYVKRPNDWAANVWTRFKIDKIALNNASKVFFAVKDVSKKGLNKGNKWPWTRGDGHNAPTSNIKTIEYSLRAD